MGVLSANLMARVRGGVKIDDSLWLALVVVEAIIALGIRATSGNLERASDLEDNTWSPLVTGSSACWPDPVDELNRGWCKCPGSRLQR